MKKVRIVPLTKRMKDRVRQHGDIMHLLVHNGEKSLVESIDKTWSIDGLKMEWTAWLTKKDAVIEEICKNEI